MCDSQLVAIPAQLDEREISYTLAVCEQVKTERYSGVAIYELPGTKPLTQAQFNAMQKALQIPIYPLSCFVRKRVQCN